MPEPNDVIKKDNFAKNTQDKEVLKFLLEKSMGPDGKGRKFRIISFSK